MRAERGIWGLADRVGPEPNSAWTFGLVCLLAVFVALKRGLARGMDLIASIDTVLGAKGGKVP